MAKQMSVNVTFKDSEEWIYREVCKHSAKAGYIKDVLAEHLKDKKEQTKTEVANYEGILNIFD